MTAERKPQRPYRRPGSQRGAPSPRETDAEELWLYGIHAVVAALGNPERRKRRVLASENARRRYAELSRLSEAAGLDVEIEKPQALDRLLPEGAVHQGVALLTAPLAERGLESLPKGGDRRQVVIALDQVTDPHNVGAVLRSAAAFGATAVLLTRRHSPAETGVLAKSASGALEHVPILRETNLARALDQLKDWGFAVAGLAGEAEGTVADFDGGARVCLVLGAEGKGLRPKTREHCDHLVRLPTRGPVDQLNVSNAAAIALYELLARG